MSLSNFVPGAGVWATLALIATSAVCGAVTDLSFSARGYAWQLINCAFTAGYSLSLRGAMDKVSAVGFWACAHILLTQTDAHMHVKQRLRLRCCQVAPLTKNGKKLDEFSMVRLHWITCIACI